jgi:ABC-type Mn2+/Zn2+ transport system ATPase subunit
MKETTPPPIVDLEGVTVQFQNVVALENVTLQVRLGDFLAVIGPNGSGKTTLIRAILGLVQPTHGTVRLFGRAPGDLGGEWSRIGYVPQITRIDPRFPIHVFDVVLMGRYGQMGLIRRPGRRDREAAKVALERVGLAELADRQIGRLSGGQRQRVLVARALAAEPELLILDEPTSGVDVGTTEGLFELLGRLRRQGMTIIVVSHDVGVVAQHVSIVACLNRTLVAHGRPKEVLRPDILECMYGREAALVGHGQTPHLVVKVHPEEEI